MRRHGLCGLLALFLFLPAVETAAAGGPTLTFGEHGVSGSGFSPGGQVVWFGLAKEVVAYEVTYVRHQQAGPADSAGQAALELGTAVPRRSLWVAVDLASGAYVIATPPDFPLVQAELPAAALTSRGASLSDQLEDEADSSEILLVRPGQGAWAATVGRGGALDEADPAARALKISLAHLDPIAGGFSGSPQKAASRDLLVVLHPDTMSAAVAVVGGRP
jgi:hypothetical protein